MAKVRGIGAGGKIEVEGLSKFRKDLKKSGADVDPAMKKANNKVAEIVIRGAKALADTKQEIKAAATLSASSTATAARVTGGSTKVPYFGGANFGAYTDRRRIIKNKQKGQSKRGRSTMVRRGERIDKVVKRIEAQHNPNTGSYVSVKRTQTGAVRVIKGWNQFRAKGRRATKWKKGEDQFLYKSVKTMYPTIQKQYQEALDKFTHDAFD